MSQGNSRVQAMDMMVMGDDTSKEFSDFLMVEQSPA